MRSAPKHVVPKTDNEGPREDARTAVDRRVGQIEELNKHVGDEVSVELYEESYTVKGRHIGSPRIRPEVQ